MSEWHILPSVSLKVCWGILIVLICVISTLKVCRATLSVFPREGITPELSDRAPACRSEGPRFNLWHLQVELEKTFVHIWRI